MKKLFLIIIFTLLGHLTFPQEILDGPQRELYLYRSNFPSYPPLIEVTNTLSAVSELYCRDPDDNSTGYICSECLANSSVKIDNYFLASSGWNICNDDSGLSYPYFGYTLYKMNNNRTDDCFFIDFRDCNYKPHNTYGYLLTDISITLNLNYDGQGHSRYEYNVSNYPRFPIVNGSVLRIWNIEYLSPPSPYIPNTSCFPEFWEDCLVLIPTSDNHPRLVWGPNPSFNSTYYRIYRAVSNYLVDPASLNYSLVSSVNSSTFDYIDYAVTILPGYQYAYYYVVGWNVKRESSRTNYVNTLAEFHKQIVEKPIEYGLLQNYPNPFNPNTKIIYSLKEAGLVKLKVFDILGSEVAELVNETKGEGNYAIEFDACNLPSGIYIYKLQAGSCTNAKKMVLTK